MIYKLEFISWIETILFKAKEKSQNLFSRYLKNIFLVYRFLWKKTTDKLMICKLILMRKMTLVTFNLGEFVLVKFVKTSRGKSE